MIHISQISASVAITDVERAFVEQVCVGDQYWWWPRMILLDPNEVIADNGMDDLYRVPFTISGTDVSFDTPVSVIVQYVDVAAGAKQEAVAAALTGIASARSTSIAASYLRREETRPTTVQGGSMNPDQLRAIMNLPADTPDEEVMRLAAVRLSADPEATPGEGDGEPPAAPAPGSGEGTGEPEEPEGDGGATPPTEASGRGNGAVLVDAAALQALQTDAAAGRQANERLQREDREREIDAAIQVGKFPRSRRDHFVRLMTIDPEGTRAHIAALANNVVPIEPVGSSGDGNEGQVASGYPPHWLPEVSRRKAALEASAASGRMPLVMSDQRYSVLGPATGAAV